MDEVHETIYLTGDTAKEINRLLGYDTGTRDENCLESAIELPKFAAFYAQADIAEQSAILLQHLAQNHTFVDGNKRTAMIMASTFLLVNHYQLAHSESEELEYAQIIERAVAQRDFREVISWIRNHIETLTLE